MLYDVYHGLKNDFETGAGELLYSRLSKSRLFAKFGSDAEKMIEGDLLAYNGDNGTVYWLEEAM